VPAGFVPQSFTAVSELEWWLLGSAPCLSAPCISIVRTTDGGRSFVGIPAPRTETVTQLRFADPDFGYAFDTELWVTHDGGASWHQLSLGGQVPWLEVGGGYVYAIVRSAATGTLMRAAIGSDRWTTLPAAGDVYAGLWVHGADVLLEGSSLPGLGDELMVSHDSGRTFARYAVPPSVACAFQEQARPVIWAHCATGMLSGVWRSTDNGTSFQPASGANRQSLPELPNSSAFAAASSTTAVVGYQQLYRTTDGGASWAPIASPKEITWWQYLGFTDSTHGVALGYAGSEIPTHQRLYYTTDGGLTYHLVLIR
jgi:photosystem II stability/assembly factor-like uncharacterized protein